MQQSLINGKHAKWPKQQSGMTGKCEDDNDWQTLSAVGSIMTGKQGKNLSSLSLLNDN